jgi:cell division protein FtsQ
MSRVRPPARAQTLLHMPDRPGLWRLLWKRQRRHFWPGVALFGLLAVGLAGTAAVQAIGQGESFRERLLHATARLGLRVQDVVLEGRGKTPEPLLRAALGVRTGDPILGFSLADARTRIETINWVQSATVERRLPGTIVVQLQERRPFAVWQLQGRFVLIDRTGDTVTDSDVASFATQVPLVVGPGAPKAAAALIDAMAAYPVIMSHMQAAVRVGERRWNLRMNNGADVLLPEGAEAPALARLMELQSTYALLDRPLQVVDLRLPDRLVVRPQPDKAETKDTKTARKPT